MCIDQRGGYLPILLSTAVQPTDLGPLAGYKHMIQAEAATFLKSSQVSYNSNIKNVTYTTSGVSIMLANGKKITADHAIVTFSVGVLQNYDVTFHPSLPAWKREAVDSMKMATYTKIFMIFPYKFWSGTEVRIEIMSGLKVS